MKTRIANEMENQENNKQQVADTNAKRLAANFKQPQTGKLANRANNKQQSPATIGGLIKQQQQPSSLESEHQSARSTRNNNNNINSQPSRAAASSQPPASQMSSLKAPAKERLQPQQPSRAAGNGALMRRPYVRFDDYLDLNEENMRRSCKRLMNHLYSAPESASAAPKAQQSAPPVMSCKVAPRWPTGAPQPQPQSQAPPPPPPPHRAPVKLLEAQTAAAYPNTMACSAPGLLVVAGGASVAPAAGKSYLRSQYELRQLRQLELMSKMKQQQQLPEAPTELAGGGTAAARQASGSQQSKQRKEQQQHPSLHHQQLQQQDLVARSHELSKQRFFERLERRKSMNISDGAAAAAHATCCRITAALHKSSPNQMSAAAAARQQMEANSSSWNRQKGLAELKGHPRQQMLPSSLPVDTAADDPAAIVGRQHQQQQRARLNGSSHPIIDECHESHGSISGSPAVDGCLLDKPCPPIDASIEAALAKSNKQQQQQQQLQLQQVAADGYTAAQLIAFNSSPSNDDDDDDNNVCEDAVGIISCQQQQQAAQFSPVTRAQPDTAEQVYQFIPAAKPACVTKVSAGEAGVRRQQTNDDHGEEPLFSDAADQLLVVLEPATSESATCDGQTKPQTETETETQQAQCCAGSLHQIYNCSRSASIAGDNKMMRPLNQTQSSARLARSTHMQQADYLFQLEEASSRGETMEAPGEQVTEPPLMHLSAPPAHPQREEAAVSLTISSENDASIIGQLPGGRASRGQLIKAADQCETTGNFRVAELAAPDSQQPQPPPQANGTNLSPETVISPLLALTSSHAVTSEGASDTVVEEQLPVERGASQAQQVTLASDKQQQQLPTTTTTITNTTTASNEINSANNCEHPPKQLNETPNPQLEPPATSSQVNETTSPYANAADPDSANGAMLVMLEEPPERPQRDNGAHHETGSRANESAPCHGHENIVLLDEEKRGAGLIESSYGTSGVAGKRPVSSGKQQSSASSLVDDDEATSSCGSSGFGASVSGTSSASGKLLNLKRANSPTVHPTSSSLSSASSASSSCSPVDRRCDAAESRRNSEQVLELYCVNSARWHEDDDQLFGYKRLVGPDQSYPSATAAQSQLQQQHPIIEQNHHNYATVSGAMTRSNESAHHDSHADDDDGDEHQPPATGNIYVNLPRAADYGSYLSGSANKMQQRGELLEAESGTPDNNSHGFSASPSLQSYSTTNSSASGGFSTLAPVAGPNAGASSLTNDQSLANNSNSRKSKSLLRRFGCLVSRAFTGTIPAGSSLAEPPDQHRDAMPAQLKSNKSASDEQATENNTPPRGDTSNEMVDGACVYEASLKEQDLVILPTKHVNQPASAHNHQEAAHTICQLDDRLSRAAHGPLSSGRSISGAPRTGCAIKPNTLQSSEALSYSLSFNSSSLEELKPAIHNEPPATTRAKGKEEDTRREEDYGYLKKSRRCCGHRKISNPVRGCIEIDCVKPAARVQSATKQRSLLRLFAVTSSATSTPVATCGAGAKSTPNLAEGRASRKHKSDAVAVDRGGAQKTSGFWGFSSLMLGSGGGGDDSSGGPEGGKSRGKQKSPTNDSLASAENRLQLLSAASQHHSLGLYHSHIHSHTPKRRPLHHHRRPHQHQHHQHHHHHHSNNNSHQHHHHHQRHYGGPLEAAGNSHFRSLQLTSAVAARHHRRGSTKRSSKGYCSGGECSLDEGAFMGAGAASSVAGQLVKINKSDGSQLIELKRTPGKPWGFFVARGSIDSTKGIFISRMHDEATSSALAGLLNIGDRILAIDECKIEPDCDILRVNQMISKKSKILLKVKPFKG